MTDSLLLPLIKKEFIHIRRDARSLVIIFCMPLMMMFIFGYAIDMDIKHVRLGISDLSKSSSSRALIQKIKASKYFNVVTYFDNPRQTQDFFKNRSFRAALIIPRDFAKELDAGFANLGIVTDGSDANTATIVQNYLEAIISEYSFSLSFNNKDKIPIQFKPKIYYNPEMISVYFTVPGIVAILMIMIGALLTSVTIVKEKETGTMEQILVSPIRAHEMILGKAIPYFFLSFIIAASIICVGYFWFNVPFAGSPILLALFCSIYIGTALALGLLISTLVATQQVAMMIALVGTMLPAIMLSGFIFPLASMPIPLQGVSQLIPATHFLLIIRGIMLKGNGFFEIWPHALKMTIIGCFFLLLAIKRFSLKLK
ncbi:MAG: hypothetical protein ACD_79C00488G0005 [uncultured bacterium]|nr:MAG: hypothetical protein ACD_79C00488G0005 [uncultured bacterium]